MVPQITAVFVVGERVFSVLDNVSLKSGGVRGEKYLMQGFPYYENKLTMGNSGSSRATVAWAARAARVGVPSGAGLQATREKRSARKSEKKAAGLKRFIS